MGIAAIRQKCKAFSRYAEWLTVSMFIGIFVLFVISVFQRYVLVQPVNWVDESILILFLWSTFLTEALVLGEFAAAVPGQRFVELSRQLVGMLYESVDDCLGVFSGDPDQHHVTRMTFNQGCDLAVVATYDQVTFPVTWHRTLLN